jgi:hypothetical protein
MLKNPDHQRNYPERHSVFSLSEVLINRHCCEGKGLAVLSSVNQHLKNSGSKQIDRHRQERRGVMLAGDFPHCLQKSKL